jgi:peptide/nickel transport system permease protein
MMARVAIVGRGPWRLAFERLRTDRAALVSAAVIAFAMALALAAPLLVVLTGHSPIAQFSADGLSPFGLPVAPNREFWLGTDGLGRDVLVRIAYGTRISLLVGVLASLAAVAMGAAIGISAAWYGGAVDALLSRATDMVLALPFLLLALALAAVMGGGLWISVCVIAFFSWAPVARVLRGEVLAIREREYIQAARALGAGGARIMLAEILPVVSPTVIVYTTLLVPSAIAFEATLSFLGIGVPPPTPSWGNMLNDALSYYKVAWWLLLLPGGALLALTLAFNVLGDSVRDAFDPRFEQTIGSGARK